MSVKIHRVSLMLLLCVWLILSTGCSSGSYALEDSSVQRIAVIGGTLIDGHGGEPILNAVILINGERIEKVGIAGDFEIPAGTTILDVNGSTILPGFINAHVHNAFSEANLKTWAAGGVTTVRDESLGSKPIAENMAWSESIKNDPTYARLISAGQMISVPGGYGSLTVTSPRRHVRQYWMNSIWVLIRSKSLLRTDMPENQGWRN